MSKPVVAIVGRPNAGKFSFLDATVGEPISIVKDVPGVTRDRIYVDYTQLDHDFTLIDTGGVESESRDRLLVSVWEQAEIAIETADVVIFLADVRTGATDADDRVADMLCHAKGPVMLVVSKVDSFAKFQDGIYEFYNLACGDPVPVSAASHLGINSLLEAVEACFSQVEESEAEEDERPKAALIDKPNVGKSLIISHLLGENRAIVSDIAGTTRDAIDMVVVHNGQGYVFIGAADIWRKSKIHEDIERYSIIHTMTAVEQVDIVLLMIDANEGVTEQGAKIAGVAYERGKGTLVIVGKRDLVEKTDKAMKEFTNRIKNIFSFMGYAKPLFVSAETGQCINKLLEIIDMIRSSQTLCIRTDALNETITEATVLKQSPSDKGHRLKISYVSQVVVKPSTFVLFVNSKELIHFSYQRYLENCICEAFGPHGIILRLFIRGRQGEDKE